MFTDISEDYFTPKSYTDQGIILLEGTRSITSAEELKLIELGRDTAHINPNCLFRSGNAPGSDESFIRGVRQVNTASIQLVLPFFNHRNTKHPTTTKVFCLDELSSVEIDDLKYLSNQANPGRKSLVNLYDCENKSRLSIKASYLLRDVLKVVGSSHCGLSPISTAIFYVNLHKPLSGGTGHTIRTCQYLNIPYLTQIKVSE